LLCADKLEQAQVVVTNKESKFANSNEEINARYTRGKQLLDKKGESS
jgi:hypothetical protein